MEFLLLAALLGLLPAVIASKKGRAFVPWWAFGAVLFVIALPASLLIKSDAEALEAADLYTGHKKKCPECAEVVKAEANVCRLCGHSFSQGQARVSA